MDKKKQWMIVVLVALLSMCGIYFWDKQAPSYKSHRVQRTYESKDLDLMQWLESYFDLHQIDLNIKDKIDSYKIQSKEEIYQLEEQEDTLLYRVIMEGQSQKAPSKLFETEPYYEDGEFSYDLALRLTYSDGDIVYGLDKPYDKLIQERDEELRPEAVDPLKELYRKESMNLEVRETIESPWVKTPLQISKFNPQSAGWYRNDNRIYFEDDEIAVLHDADEGGMAVTQSHDQGKTWKTNQILDNKGVGQFGVAFGYIGFVGDEGIVVLSHSIAGSSEIMTMYQTEDNGHSWEAGRVPEGSRSPYGVSFVDEGRVFVTYNDDPDLYVTQDLGETYRSIEIPDYKLKDEPYLSDDLEWADFYIQAEPPFIDDNKYYMTMSQGELGDYNRNANALYVSHDKAETWEFLRYEYPVKEKEEN